MTPPTVTPEEMVASIDVVLHETPHVPAALLRRVRLTAARDFIQSRAAKDAATKASAEDALDAWWHEDHFGEKCGVGHTEECVSTAFTDGYSAGFRAAKERT